MRSIPRLMVALTLLLCACGSDSTGGRPVILRTELRVDPEESTSFTTPSGWSVQLRRAALSVGALYYFDGEPAFVMRPREGLRERLAQLSWTSVARAHPGHYGAGNALGQMLVTASADLLAGVTSLPVGHGVSGSYRSARFVFGQPQGESDRALLGDQVASVEGVASKVDRTVHFRLSASLADIARSVAGAQVDGCVFDEAEIARDGLISVRVRPRVWFSLVDFEGVAPGTAEAPTQIAAGQTAQIAFALGLSQLSAYHFSYAP